ncbi:transmembrane protein 234 homolog [Trichonephila inaurata madagascariensis]|uniref:Transmembrane protein 234 homolog n=1 Tax=Trichonephila inaurata madagascariensis TaxID=2747483 RepID=A0A8X7CJW2_9ARAC|nr:transmembrane protein 234 homolog [Trichonephila inaurata madagascariensis]
MCGSIAWLIVVAAVWGFSTPLIRHGSAGIENITCSNPLSQWLAELRFLATNWKYIFPFLINQSGSALYTLALGSADLSLAVPLTNSLTFIFVSISGRLLGEKGEKSASYLGMTFVAAGVTLCVLESTLK